MKSFQCFASTVDALSTETKVVREIDGYYPQMEETHGGLAKGGGSWLQSRERTTKYGQEEGNCEAVDEQVQGNKWTHSPRLGKETCRDPGNPREFNFSTKGNSSEESNSFHMRVSVYRKKFKNVGWKRKGVIGNRIPKLAEARGKN